MEKRRYKSTALEVSLLGLGCMRLPKVGPDTEEIDKARAQEIVDYAYSHGVNYFDTAYMYHGGASEPFIGPALKKYPRESYCLASKMPVWMCKDEAEVERVFNEQLAKCQVDYFDFYLCHSLNKDHFERIEKLHVYDFLQRMKKEGKICRLGFSFHDKPEVLRTIVAAHQWDFAQIQLNYLDWEMQDAKTQYEILTENGIQVIVMEPVRGGALASLCPESDAIFKQAEPERSVASWAVRYAASLPNVLTVLSGMSNMEQVQDNVATMTDFRPLSREEYQIVEHAVDTYRKNKTVPCTGCRYCMDCPFGVDIPAVFRLYNQYAISGDAAGFKAEYERLGAEHQAAACKSCGACTRVCPQHIESPKRMKEIAELYASL